MGVEQLLILIVGLNAVSIGTVGLMWLRVGRLEGRLNNGDYLRCPFYKGGHKKEK